MSTKRHRVSNLKLREISSVDRPAQVGAVSVLIKRRESAETELIKATFQQALTGCLLADQVREAFYSSFENMYEGKDAFRKALVDELAAGGDGSAAATDYKNWLAGLVDMATVAAKAAGAAQVTPEELNKAFTEAAEAWLADQETDMTIKTKAELTAAIEKAQAAGDKVTVGDVTAIHKAATELSAEDLLPATGVLAKAAPAVDAEEFAKMKKVSELTPVEKAAYDKLTDPAAKLAFLNKSATERATDIEKAAGDDPVVYTTIDGVDIRKSMGEVTLAMAKRADAQDRELAKARAASEDSDLTKRAGDILGNVGGELVGKKALLKALDSITDASTRTAAEAVLKSANELGKGAFVRKGAGGGNAPVTTAADGSEMSEAEAELDRLAKAAAVNGKDYHTAYAEVIQTVEGSQLYKRFVEGE